MSQQAGSKRHFSKMSRTVVCDGYCMENIRNHEIFVLTKFRFLCPILKNRKAVEGVVGLGLCALNAAWVWDGFKSLQRMSLTYMCYILSYPRAEAPQVREARDPEPMEILLLVNAF